jgi:hypothetical protein
MAKDGEFTCQRRSFYARNLFAAAFILLGSVA